MSAERRGCWYTSREQSEVHVRMALSLTWGGGGQRLKNGVFFGGGIIGYDQKGAVKGLHQILESEIVKKTRKHSFSLTRF